MAAYRGIGFWSGRAGVMLAVLVASGSLLACVIETEPPARRPLLRDALRARAAPAATIPVSPPVPEAFQTCETDTDCVAVLPNGCCHDGRSVALNKGLVDAYRSAFTCPIPSPACPTNLVLDRRIAACNAATHACKLVDPPTAPP